MPKSIKTQLSSPSVCQSLISGPQAMCVTPESLLVPVVPDLEIPIPRSYQHFQIILYPQAIYSLSGKCFTTQGAMQHRVIFPSKPNGLTVLTHAPKDIADKMDPEVANW